MFEPTILTCSAGVSRLQLVLSVVCCVVGASWPVATAGPQASRKAAEILTLMGRYHELGEFNGSVLVAQRAQVLVDAGYGFADIASSAPNTPETTFLIGSISKQFTAAVVMKLVEQGRLSFKTTLADALPYYRRDTGAKVTVRHLLDHTAGIAAWGEISDLDRASMSTADFVKRHCSGDLQFEPGSRFAYSNAGYVVLGAVIEQVTGKSYEQVLREVVLDPLKMASTGMGRLGVVRPRPAGGYQRRAGAVVSAPPFDPLFAFSAGGLYSSTADLARWERAFHEDSILSPASRAVLASPLSNSYTCGLRFARRPIGPNREPRDVVFHGGRVPGFAGLLLRVPDDRLLVVLLNNTDSTRLESMARDILDVVYGRKPREARRSLAGELRSALGAMSVEGALNSVRRLRATEGDLYDPEPEELQLNALGYENLHADRHQAAIAAFTLAVEQFPASWNAHDSLGEAQLASGLREQAIASYRKSLSLNPANQGAADKLKALGADRRRPSPAGPFAVSVPGASGHASVDEAQGRECRVTTGSSNHAWPRPGPWPGAVQTAAARLWGDGCSAWRTSRVPATPATSRSGWLKSGGNAMRRPRRLISPG